MKHKVYYGEYSLSHWIDLILSKNIILPEYQRLFVWDKKQVLGFLNSIKQDNYVPPVTIGLYKVGNKTVNYILDGQQRLTSIILSLFDIFPKKGSDVVKCFQAMNENDDEISDEDLTSAQEWRFDRLTNLGNTYDEINDKINDIYYERFDSGYTTGDYKNHFLGFSYIVPNVDNEKEQQSFYATIFRNINFRGSSLNVLESREALYFLDNSITSFFKADIGQYYVISPMAKVPLDFVRYLALLAQYHNTNPKSTDRLAAGYGSKKRIEEYYETYIYSVVGNENSDIFAKFEDIFLDRNFFGRIELLKSNLQTLKWQQEYPSIIDIDLYMFGIIYEVVFLNHSIDERQRATIKKEIDSAIEIMKSKAGHKKSPAALKYLRERIEKSIEIYSKYAI